MKHENASRMLVNFYNITLNARYRSNRDNDIDAIIADDESNVSDIRKAIGEWKQIGKECGWAIERFCEWYKYERNAEKKCLRRRNKKPLPPPWISTSDLRC